MYLLMGIRIRIRSFGPFPAGEGRYLQAGAECQFLQDIVYMTFHRMGGDVKTLGDFLVAQAFGNQGNNLSFTIGQLYRIAGNAVAGFERGFDDLSEK